MDKELMKEREKHFIENINKRPILVWGARMTGMGLLRFSKKYDLNVIGFVDGDPSLTGRSIGDFKINKPDVIPSLKKKCGFLCCTNFKGSQIYVKL